MPWCVRPTRKFPSGKPATAVKSPASAGLFFALKWLNQYNAPMLNIKPGQRWISTAEPELGLGTILRADHRQADIIFTGSGELKHFTHASSPLLRVSFEAGDCLFLDATARQVEAVHEDENGMLVYQCGNDLIPEGSIDPEQLAIPAPLRLLIGQYDSAPLFELRRMALQADALDQDAFEQFAVVLLAHFGCRFSQLSEHRFLIDAGDSALEPEFDCHTPCSFALENALGDVQCIHHGHPLIAAANRRLLESRTGNAAFLIDDTLPARSAVLETVFRAGDGSLLLLALDAKGNRLAGYAPNDQAVFRSRDSQIDIKPFKRSLTLIYPALLQSSRAIAAESGHQRLEALRLVVGAEFAVFGRNLR
jgi:hypothetical protein